MNSTYETRNGIGGSRLVQNLHLNNWKKPQVKLPVKNLLQPMFQSSDTHFRIGGRTPAQYQRQRAVSVYFILGNHFPLPIVQAIDEVGNHSAARVDELVRLPYYGLYLGSLALLYGL